MSEADKAVIRRHGMRELIEIELLMNTLAIKIYNERIKKRYEKKNLPVHLRARSKR